MSLKFVKPVILFW